MRTIVGAVLTAMAVLTITACSGSPGSAAAAKSASSSSAPLRSPSSSSLPLRSDVAACREFASWYRQFGPHDTLDNTSKMIVLMIGISEAPPDQLHQDLSVLESDVIEGSKARGSLGRAKERMTANAARTVAQDCQAVDAHS